MVSFLQKSLTQARKYNDPENESDSLIQFGNLYIATGEFDKAVSVLEEALGIAQQTGSQDLIAQALYRLSKIAKQRRKKEKAIRLARESQKIFESIKHKMVPVVRKYLKEE